MNWARGALLSYRASLPLMLIALAISIGVVAGPVAWRLKGEPVGLAALAPVAPPRPVTDTAGRTDISGVLAKNPFGAILQPQTPEVPVGETNLGLVLLGLTLGNSDENSRAMIADASAEAKSYAVGAELGANVSINAILSDHVVLSVDGTLQTLSFPNAVSTTLNTTAPLAESAAASGVAALNRLVPENVSYFIANPEESSDPDAVIARYRAAIRQNPVSVMLRLGIEATSGGYIVKQDTSQGVLNAGFRPGDIIRTVNGETVGKLQSDVELFDKIALAGLAQVEVVRNGEVIKLAFPLR